MISTILAAKKRAKKPVNAWNIWVVEMFAQYRKWQPDEWRPCASKCGLTRDGALPELRQWRMRNPCDKFRLRKYARVEIRRKA